MHPESGNPMSHAEIEEKFYEKQFCIAAHGYVDSLKLFFNTHSLFGKSPHIIKSVIASREIEGELQEIRLTGGGVLGVTVGEERTPLLVCPLEAAPYSVIMNTYTLLKFAERIILPDIDDMPTPASQEEADVRDVYAIKKYVEKDRYRLTSKLIFSLQDGVDDIRRQYREQYTS